MRENADQNNSEYGHFSRSCNDYNKIFFVNFKTSLGNVLRHCSTDFKVFEYIFTSVLNEYALKKKEKVIWVIISLVWIKNWEK